MIKELLRGDHLGEVGKEQGLGSVPGLGWVVDLVMVALLMEDPVMVDLDQADLVMEDLDQVEELDRGKVDPGLVMGLDLEKGYLQDQGHHHRHHHLRQELGR